MEWMVALSMAAAGVMTLLAVAAARSERRASDAYTAGERHGYASALEFTCEEFGHRLASTTGGACFCGKKAR